MTKAMELRQKKAQLIADIRTELAKDQTAETRAKVEAMKADVVTMTTDIENLDAQDALELSLRNATNPVLHVDPNADANGAAEAEKRKAEFYRAAHAKYLRFGKSRLNAEEHRALAEGTASEGGYTVPTLFNKDIQIAEKAFGPILTKLHSFHTDNGDPMQIPLANDTATVAVELSENTQVTEADLAFQQMTFTPVQMTSGIVQVSNQLLEDSGTDIAALLTNLFGIRYARGLTAKVTNGSTDTTSIHSLLSKVAQKATIITKGTLVYQDVVNIFAALDPAYRDSPSTAWSFNNTVYGNLLGIVDTYGRPILVASLASGAPDTIFGKPVVLNQSLPNLTASGGTLAVGYSPIMFGAWDSYWLRDAGSPRMVRLTERYADYNQTAFILFRRVAGQYLNAGTNPIIAFEG